MLEVVFAMIIWSLILDGLEHFSSLVDALALCGSTLVAAMPERPTENLCRGRAKCGVPCDPEALLVLTIVMLLSPTNLKVGVEATEGLFVDPFILLVDRLAALAAENVSTIFVPHRLCRGRVRGSESTQGSMSSLGLKICFTCLKLLQIKIKEPRTLPHW